MRFARFVLTVFAVLALCSCSLFRSGGGSSSEGDQGLGEGNIPIAQPGSELLDINFDFDSSIISARAQEDLRVNSTWFLDNPDQRAIIEGHCDERGTAEYNLALGERRTRAVFDYLKNLGIGEAQMDTVSYGEELPLDRGHNENAWATNRRAHFSAKE